MPRVISTKFPKKLKLAMVLSRNGERKTEKKLSTSGKPLTVKIKHTMTLSTKAITWLRVSADKNEPIAK